MRIPRRTFNTGQYNATKRLPGISRQHSSGKTSDALKILFCGSDEFSIASLKALHAESRDNPGSITNIDVVCRPDKRVGRGLKSFREGGDP